MVIDVDVDVWNRLAADAAALVAGHLDLGREVGGTGEDGAFRGLLRGLVEAVTAEMDGDRLSACGALAEALADASWEATAA